MTELFTLPLLQAISDWQIGGNPANARQRGLALEGECAALPSEFKAVPSACFRRVVLKKGNIWDLLGEQALLEKISSWTFDLALAKDFKQGVPPKGVGLQGVIFERMPHPEEVVVNLSRLFRDPAFKAAVAAHKGSIERFSQGMGKYSDTQCEIVLKVETLSQDHIYSIGGHSGSPEEILQQTIDQAFGAYATAEQREWMRWVMSVGPVVTGPKWLSQEATRTVLSRVEPLIPPLRVRKAGQGA